MTRSTIITGNGLGMCLDPEYFALDRAINHVWNSPECLSEDQKALIVECIARQGGEGFQPRGEEDLDILHRVVLACRYLSVIGQGDIHWLSDHGNEFPGAIEKFITSVAWYFHNHDHQLDDDFLDSISEYVQQTQSHIATLNYDNLLYQSLIERDVLTGYDGALVDGFHGVNGFNEDNLDRKYGRTFGYYLHLHGSPLYIESGTSITKQRQGDASEVPTKHLVLTHVEHKPSVIDSSNLLKAYWRRLAFSVRESEKIVIVGCSGLDKHLNRFIKALSVEKRKVVIEWVGSGDGVDREEFWESELGDGTEVHQYERVLNFNNWADV